MPPKKSGLALPVGTNTRWRAGSTVITDQALPAPAVRVAPSGALATACSGSQLQRRAPVWASKARTTPLGITAWELSSMDDPTTTSPSITAGGEVMWYCPGMYPATSRRLTCPLWPKSWQALPVAASRAIRRASTVASNRRVRHVVARPALGSVHAARPRLINPSPTGMARSIRGSKLQRWRPVAGSSASTRLKGVVR